MPKHSFAEENHFSGRHISVKDLDVNDVPADRLAATLFNRRQEGPFSFRGISETHIKDENGNYLEEPYITVHGSNRGEEDYLPLTPDNKIVNPATHTTDYLRGRVMNVLYHHHTDATPDNIMRMGRELYQKQYPNNPNLKGILRDNIWGAGIRAYKKFKDENPDYDDMATFHQLKRVFPRIVHDSDGVEMEGPSHEHIKAHFPEFVKQAESHLGANKIKEYTGKTPEQLLEIHSRIPQEEEFYNRNGGIAKPEHLPYLLKNKIPTLVEKSVLANSRSVFAIVCRTPARKERRLVAVLRKALHQPAKKALVTILMKAASPEFLYTPAATGDVHVPELEAAVTTAWKNKPVNHSRGGIGFGPDGTPKPNNLGMELKRMGIHDAPPEIYSDPRTQRRHLLLTEDDIAPTIPDESNKKDWHSPLTIQALTKAAPELFQGKYLESPNFPGGVLAVSSHIPPVMQKGKDGKYNGHIPDGALEVLLHAGMHGKDWYDEFANALAAHHDDPKEAQKIARVFGITGLKTSPLQNYNNMTKVMGRYQRGMADDPEHHNWLMDNQILQKLGTTSPSAHEIHRALNNKDLTSNYTKLMDYTAGFLNRYGVAVDEWMRRAFVGLDNAPSHREYDYITGRINTLAKKHNLTPNQAQAAVWVGYKKMTHDYVQGIKKMALGKDPEKFAKHAGEIDAISDQMHQDGRASYVMDRFGRATLDKDGNIESVKPLPQTRFHEILGKHQHLLSDLVRDNVVKLEQSKVFDIAPASKPMQASFKRAFAQAQADKDPLTQDLEVDGNKVTGDPEKLRDFVHKYFGKEYRVPYEKENTDGPNPGTLIVNPSGLFNQQSVITDEDRLKKMLVGGDGTATEFGKDMAEIHRLLNTAEAHNKKHADLRASEKKLEAYILAKHGDGTLGEVSTPQQVKALLAGDKTFQTLMAAATKSRANTEGTDPGAHIMVEGGRTTRKIAERAHTYLPHLAGLPVQFEKGGNHYESAVKSS